MSDPWIRLHANLAHKPVIWRLADHCGISKHEAMGVLAEFWGNVSQHAKNGHVGQMPDAQLEAWADWRGDRGLFAAFVRAQHVDDDGRVNEWDEYHGKLEIRRESDRKRKEVQRTSSGHPQDFQRTSAGLPADVTRTVRTTIRDDTSTKQTTKATTSASRSGPAAWTVPLVELWSSRVGPTTHGRLGKALKPLFEQYGAEKLECGLLLYVTSNAEKPRKLEWFRDDAIRWIEPPEKPPIIDEWGVMTEYGERVSRPPNYRP